MLDRGVTEEMAQRRLRGDDSVMDEAARVAEGVPPLRDSRTKRALWVFPLYSLLQLLLQIGCNRIATGGLKRGLPAAAAPLGTAALLLS